jgi:hypothetical protein
LGLVEGLAGRAVLAPGLVAQLGVFRQGAGVLLDRDAGAAQVISQQVEDAVLFSDRVSFHAHGEWDFKASDERQYKLQLSRWLPHCSDKRFRSI